MKKHIGILVKVLGYYFIYIIAANIGLLLLLLGFHKLGIKELSEISGEFVSDVILLPLLIIIFGLYTLEKRKELFELPISWKNVLKLIPISLIGRILLVLAIGFIGIIIILFLKKDISEIIDSGVQYQWDAFDHGQGIEKLYGFLSFAIFGPLNEELLNRAIIFGYLRKFYSTKVSIIYSSIIFALAHLHPGLYISSFVLGIILALVYTKWKNIWYPIILHILINIQPFILSYFIK